MTLDIAYEHSDIFLEQEERRKRYEKYVKPGRWIYCKYCYGNRTPVIDWYDGLIKCGHCDYGLVPLQDEYDIILWIIGEWWNYIEIKFIVEKLKYDLGKKEKIFSKNETDEQIRKAIDEGNRLIEEIETKVTAWRQRHDN